MARPPKPKRSTNKDGTVTVTGKAANGQGSVYFHAAKNCWVATYVDASGKRRTTSAPTQAEARQRRDAKLATLSAQRPTSVLGANPTVSKVAQWWLENLAPAKARPTTLLGYTNDVKRLTKLIGDLPVSELDYPTAETTIRQLRDSYGYGTTRNARARLRQIAETAIELGYLQHNPVTKVTTPAKTETERAPKRVLSPEEVAKLFSVLDGDGPLDAALAILFTNGLRASEVLGLAWSDIDLDAGTAQVLRGCTYTPATGCRLDKPKTERTVGTITLSPLTVELLRARKTQQAENRLAAIHWEETSYEGETISPVFTSLTGRLVREQRLGAALETALERAGLPPSASTHMGRRSVITNLDAAGVALHAVADYVGHSSTNTTEGYLQQRAERSKEVAAVVANIYGEASKAAKAERA